MSEFFPFPPFRREFPLAFQAEFKNSTISVRSSGCTYTAGQRIGMPHEQAAKIILQLKVSNNMQNQTN